ncbi:MAG TPA: Ig-like domain repeat protein [Acidobacteriaceae bacterium]|nr:Ig-like domain repeat protein [Acidobacteriaceae bacterium]
MNAIFACSNASSPATRISYHRKTSRHLVSVMAGLAFLCGMGPLVHAQAAYYAGVTSPIDTTHFTEVEGMATDAAGNLFVAATDGTAWNVYKIAHTGPGTYSTTPAAQPVPAGGYPCSTDPCLRGVAFDSNQNLWVADFGGQVYELVNTSGTLGTPTLVGSGSWTTPWGIAADTSGNVFVTDNAADTVSEISGGTPTVVYTGSSSGIQQPRGIALDSAGDLFVVDGVSSQVKELIPPYTAAAPVIVNNTGFQGPGDIAFDTNGNLWVSEFTTNSAREITGWDSYAGTFTSIQTWGSGLNGPVAVWPSIDGTMIVANVTNGAIQQINYQPLNFGTVALGSASTSQTVTFSFTASTTIGAPLVVTQGGTGQDFVDAGGGSCQAGTYAPPATCTVDVKFAPKTPGNRAGAVELVDSSGNVAQAFLYGTATGPEITFSPSTGTTKLGATFTSPQKIAVDGSGDIFVVDSVASTVTEILANGGTKPITLPSPYSFSRPWSIAIGGAGNLFVGESGNNRIDEIYAPNYTTGTPLPGAYTPLGLAVDNNGNLFVADPPAVRELTAASGYATVLTLNSSFGKPFGVAVDPSGDVWVAGDGVSPNPSLTELGPTGSVINTFSGFSSPEAVAVDPAGNVYVADSGGGTITELTKASNYATSVTLATISNDPAGVALDSSGNVYYSTNASDNSVYEINLAAPPSLLTFATSTAYKTLSTEEQSVTLSNIGNADLTFSAINFSTTSFGVAADSGCIAGSSLTSADSSCLLKFSFTPQTVTNPVTGTATLIDNAGTGSQAINLSGTAMKADLTLSWTPSTASIPYGTDLSGVLPAAASCTGCGTFAYTASGVGAVNANTILSVAGSPYTLTATFTQTDTTDYNPPSSTQITVNLTVTKATTTISVAPSASAITYGQTLSASNLTGGTVVSGATSVTGHWAYTTPTTAPTAGTDSESVIFTPDDTADYDTVTGTASVVVNKATTTVVTLPTASAITYGQTLASSTLTGGTAASGGTNVPGKYTYTTPTTLPTAGTDSESVTFTPDDAVDYDTVTGSVNVVVSKATLTVATLPTASAITYGQTLASSILTGGTAASGGTSVPGSYAFTTPTLEPTAGTDSESVTFTATDAVDYNTVTASVNVTVNQATTTVTWALPVSIIYGTPLSATQLNASANVLGSFTYTPPAGTILPVGAGQTLSVSFIPSDTVDYKSSMGTTTITVTAGSLIVSANNATRVYGTANPSFSGSVAGAQGSDTFSESFSSPATITSNAGTYPIVPSASGTDLGDYTVVIDNGTLTISKANTTTGLSASGSSVNPGASLTLSATVASATSGTPTGTVSFYDGTTLLGTGTLTGGVATYSTTTLAAGSSNTVTAVYSGDTNFNTSSTTTSTVVTVGMLDFTLGTPSPATQSGSSGGSFQYSFNISPLYGAYAGPVSFTATGLPTGAVATFSPSTIPANGGAQTVNMTVSTAPASAALVHPSTAGRGLIPIALAFLFLPLAGTKRMRREGRRFGRLACLLLLVLAGLGATAALTGCGSHNGGFSGTEGYTITITATSGAIQHTSTVTLDLQ